MILMSNVTPFVKLLEQGCESWRKGDDQQGIDSFQQACLHWLDWLENMKQEKAPSNKIIVSCTRIMHQVLEHLSNQDTIPATDLLEYDLLPILRSINDSGEVEPLG